MNIALSLQSVHFEELDMEGVIEGDEESPEQEMGDDSLEVTEEMMEQANDKRMEAMEAYNDGKKE